jgi:hypothetical protein
MTVFAFSDECGNYDNPRSEKFIKTHPFFTRATVYIDSAEYKFLESRFATLRRQNNLPSGEIKWSYIWFLRKYQERGVGIPADKEYHFLRNVDYKIILKYVSECLEVLDLLAFTKIVFTLTDNGRRINYSPETLYRMHLETILERTQYEFQRSAKNLAVLFCDPVGESCDRELREAFFEISNNGAFVDSFTNVKDSLNFEYSHHSVGIQLADYLAGSFTGALRGFDDSIQIFKSYAHHIRSLNGRVFGVGITEIPRSERERQSLKELLQKRWRKKLATEY